LLCLLQILMLSALILYISGYFGNKEVGSQQNTPTGDKASKPISPSLLLTPRCIEKFEDTVKERGKLKKIVLFFFLLLPGFLIFFTEEPCRRSSFYNNKKDKTKVILVVLLFALHSFVVINPFHVSDQDILRSSEFINKCRT
jgi:hypothetical protein